MNAQTYVDENDKTLKTAARKFREQGFAILPGWLDAGWLLKLQAHTEKLTNLELAPASAAPLTDLEPLQLDGKPVVQRVRKPYEVDDFFFDLASCPQVVSLLEPLLGPNIRLHHGKINVKAPQVGSPLEWHQDWAFIPHSNQSMAIISILIDDCPAEKGPVQFIAGSHTGPLHPHHHDEVFVGAIDSQEIDLSLAQAAIGPPGTVTIHHPMMIHGSGLNQGNGPRRMLFLEYAAADAWPLFYGVDWSEFNQRMICGETTHTMRFTESSVRMPYPNASEGQGRIYDLQRSFSKRHFSIPGEPHD